MTQLCPAKVSPLTARALVTCQFEMAAAKCDCALMTRNFRKTPVYTHVLHSFHFHSFSSGSLGVRSKCCWDSGVIHAVWPCSNLRHLTATLF